MAPTTRKRKTSETEEKEEKKEKKEKKETEQEEKTDQANESSKTITKWLLKAEPESRVVSGVDVRFSISDLRAAQRSAWDGVRSYEARNHLRRMRVGDECLFYHSSCRTPGVAGLARVVEAATPDAAAFDASHPYFDPKSDAANPRWFAVAVEFVAEFERLIPLKELQGYAELKDMALIKRGRLSVQPVRDCEFDFIRSLAALKDE